jgi:hypothetical protein
MAAVTPLQAIAERVADGGVLDTSDARAILDTRDLIAIGMIADGLRRDRHGPKTTFLRVLELHVEAVPSELVPGASAGEFRLTGEPVSIEAAVAAVAAARRLAGGTFLSGFSLAWLAGQAASAPDVFSRLAAAGLDGVAEVPVDADGLDGALAAARGAGLRAERLIVATVPTDPVGLLERARQLQARVGGFRAFAPLPRHVAATAPTTGYDDVKLVAAARVVVRDIPSIQVDWPLYGPKLAQVALTFGADDVDGIAAVEQGLLGARRSALEEIKGNIRAAALEPIERDGRFAPRAAVLPGGES